MENTVYVKQNGVVSECHSAKFVDDKVQDKECHLCGKCVNGYPSKCSKIADRSKKSIIDYDFITSGCQTFDEDGNSDILIVEECNNYVKAQNNKNKNKAQIAKYKELKRQLAAAYFGTETPDEAYLFQAELIERGHLKFNKNDLPDPKTLELIKKRLGKKL